MTPNNHIFLLFWILALAIPSTAQEIKCENPVPTDFRLYSSQKFESSRDSIRNERRRARKTKEDFLLASHFLNDAILNSGRVLFNDPVSEYLNEILDVLLADDPELRAKVRAYALRSTSVNAFATDNGIILMNLGLIARAESEAQLAFILSHELSHYTEQHVFDSYLKNKDLFQGKGNHRSSGTEERLMALNLYSKELEIVADSAAFQRMSKTEYDTSGMLEVFEMLRFAHTPFEDKVFDPNFFSLDGYDVNPSFLLDKVRTPEPFKGGEKDDLTTHPDPNEREQVVLRWLDSYGAHGGSPFVISQKKFDHVRDLSRREMVRLYRLANDPVMAVYSAYTLIQASPEDETMKMELAKGLYSIAKNANHGRKRSIVPDFVDQQGEAQQLVHLIYKMSERELNVLAFRHLQKMSLEIPGNEDLEAMANDLLTELVFKHHSNLPFARETTEVRNEIDPVQYALTPLFKEPTFSKQFDLKVIDSRKRVTLKQKKLDFKQDQKLEQFHKNHGFAVGAEKVVFVDPQYGRYDLRKSKRKLFKSSEASGILLGERIERSAELVNLEMEMLAKDRIDSMDAELFNDITFLNEWVDQRFRGLDINMVVTDRARLDSLIEKYGTEHFVWSGLLTYREKKPFLFYYAMYALVPPAIPVALYYLLRPNYDSYYFCICFNLKTGEPEMVTYNNFKQNDARDMVNSNVYDSLYQLKRKPNKKGK